jgi:hypothetical protein
MTNTLKKKEGKKKEEKKNSFPPSPGHGPGGVVSLFSVQPNSSQRRPYRERERERESE